MPAAIWTKLPLPAAFSTLIGTIFGPAHWPEALGKLATPATPGGVVAAAGDRARNVRAV